MVLLGVLFVAARLGPDQFGQFALIQATALIFTSFCALSLGQMASKIVAESRLAGPGRTGSSITIAYACVIPLSLLLAAALVCSAGYLADRSVGSPQLASAYRLSALLVIAGFLIAVQGGIILGLDLAREQALVNMKIAPITLAILLLFALQDDLLWALAGLIIAQGSIVLAQEYVIYRYRKMTGIKLGVAGIPLKQWSVIWRLGLPSSVAGFFTVPAVWLVMMLLAAAPGGMAELGQFALGNQVRGILLFGAGVIANVSLPAIASALMRGDREQADQVFTRSLAVVVLLSILLALSSGLLLAYVIPGYFPAYIDSLRPMAWLLMSAVVASVTAIYMRKATAEMRPGTLVLANAAFSLALIGSAWYLLSVGQGATGLAISFLIASILQLGLFVVLNRHYWLNRSRGDIRVETL